MRSSFVLRIRLVSACIVVIALVLAARLYLVQVVRGADYAERADRQYLRPQESLFNRGSIFFTDKDGRRAHAATLANGFTLAINPSIVDDPLKLYETLREYVQLDRDVFLAQAGKRSDPYEVVATRLGDEKASAIAALALPSVVLHRERWRYYPGGELAAQTLGFVAYGEGGDERAGRYGLERYYDDVLARREETAYVNFFAEIFASVGETLAGTRRGDGHLVTSIEPTVQVRLDEEVAAISAEWQSRSTGGIIIDPMTGEVFALAIHPSLDLNRFQEVEDAGRFKNPLVESVFEMGSIIKALTMAIGIDTKAVGPLTTYNDRGFLLLDGGAARIANYDGKGRGVVDMRRVLGESLNTGAAFVVGEIGNRRFAEYMKAFGLGEETGIDQPGEVHGFLENLKSPRDVEYATASFGQGIALTPVATVRALAALANGGYLVTPHVVKRIEYEVGPTKNIFYEPRRHVLTPQTSEEITRMLVYVVDNYLLDGTVKFPRYSVAAKTGTAQIADTARGGYYDDRFFHSFFGYFPAYDPQFLIFLYTEEPRGVRFASQTLTHPFIDLAEFLISYYEIPPDR